VDVEPDLRTLAQLQAGQAPFDEPGLGETIAKHAATGQMRFTDSYDQAAASAEIHFVCVPTPQTDGALAADLSHIQAAVTDFCRRAHRDCLIVAKSSVPVGTAQRLGEQAQAAARPGVTVSVAYSHDFLRESTSMQDAAHPSRIIVGIPRRRPGRDPPADRLEALDRRRSRPDRHRRTRQVRRQCLPRHQDLLHQLHQRDL